MRKQGIPEAHASHPNVTPLIDVVMCLIIFFMLVARIGVSTGAEEMDLPKAILGTEIEDLGNTLVLNVRNIGTSEPMVTALVDGQNRELRFQENVGGRMVNPLLEVLKAFKARNPEAKLIIRAQRDTPFELLEPVLFVSAEADVNNVNFATEQVTVTQ